MIRWYRGGWLWAAAWTVCGFLMGFSVITAASIGNLILPVAIVLTLVVFKYARLWPEGLGFALGIGVPLAWLLAWLAGAGR